MEHGIMRAVVYSRVSTDSQERDGTSLDTQERACIEYVEAQGWSVVERIRDTASGFSLDRPGIERVRQLLRNGAAEVAVCYAVDRLSRNQNHIGVLFDEVQQTEAKLEFVTEKFEDTAIGRFVLAARAFIGEVEREKIAERTMRGKAERARSGRIPQGTGKGCYGYHYDRETGQRRVNEAQAAVIRRLFTEFAGGASIIGLANSLNAEGITTFTGKSWHPATVYHLLQNETYSGRTVYRRTRAVQVRDPKTGKSHRRVERRSSDDWIEVPSASPAIVSTQLYQAVYTRLNDPERLRQGRRVFPYPLSGHLSCAECGKAMVGQTLQRRYRYYRCRRAFSGPRHDRCGTRYVRAPALEKAILERVAELLSRPEIVHAELVRLNQSQATEVQLADLRSKVKAVEAEKQRLLRLYQWGEVDEEYFQRESQLIRGKRDGLTTELELNAEGPRRQLPDQLDLTAACRRVSEWVAQASSDDMSLLMEALSIEVSASTDGAHLNGVIPEYAPDCSDADVRSMVIGPAAAPTVS